MGADQGNGRALGENSLTGLMVQATIRAPSNTGAISYRPSCPPSCSHSRPHSCSHSCSQFPAHTPAGDDPRAVQDDLVVRHAAGAGAAAHPRRELQTPVRRRQRQRARAHLDDPQLPPPSLLPPPCSHPCPHRSSSGARAHLDAAQRRRAPREGERPGGAPPLALRAGRDGRRRRRRGLVPRQAQGLCGAAEGGAAAAQGVHRAGTRPSFPPQCHPFTPAAPCRPHSHPQRTHPIPLWTPRPFTPHPLGPPRRRSSRCRTASRRARSPRSRRRRGSRSRRSTSTSPTSRSSATPRSATMRSTCSSKSSRRPTRR